MFFFLWCPQFLINFLFPSASLLTSSACQDSFQVGIPGSESWTQVAWRIKTDGTSRGNRKKILWNKWCHLVTALYWGQYRITSPLGELPMLPGEYGDYIWYHLVVFMACSTFRCGESPHHSPTSSSPFPAPSGAMCTPWVHWESSPGTSMSNGTLISSLIPVRSFQGIGKFL